MKTPSPLNFLTLATVCLLIVGLGPSHADNTWDGGSLVDSNWNTAENWGLDTLPTLPGALTFDGTSRLDPFNDYVGAQVDGFTFGATADSFVISGNAITLGGNIVNQSTNIQTINLDMSFSGTRNITLSGGAFNSGGGVTLNGDISGTGALSTVSSSSGTITLNGNNSHSGGTTLSNGSSSQDQAMNLGHSNALGTGTFTWSIGSSADSYFDNTSGSAMTIANEVNVGGAGTMRFVGSDDITFSGDVTLTGGSGREIVVGAGTVTFGGDLFLSDNSGIGRNLQLKGPGDLTIEGVIANYDGVGGTAGGISHTGTGTLTLSNEANTYTGATVMGGGSGTSVIVVTKLADGGEASSIGASSNARENLRTATSSSQNVLRYIGSGDSTDRLFAFGLPGFSGTTLTIESSGTGALHFTNNTGATEIGGSTATLVLGGTYVGDVNTMAVDLSPPVGTLSLRKEGPGTWALTNANGYTGSTTVNGGTLLISGSGSINSTSSVTVNDSGSTFEYTSSVGLDRSVTVNTGGTFVHSGSTNFSGNFGWTDGTLGGTNWNGYLDNLTVNANRTISPGNSPGTASTGDQTWGTDGSYIWEINDAVGTAGTDWDLVSGTGDLNIGANSTDRFTIFVTSLTSLDAPGDAANFNQSLDFQWLIADFATPVSNFASDNFAIDTSGFTNATAPGSEFAVVLGDTVVGGNNSQIFLTYTIPEPQTALLVGIGLATLLLRRRSR